MRVIGGTYRSRRLIAPPGLDTRPTSDRLRETLFNVLGDAVAGSVWLDLYAGSGAIGIEALSRGARQVYFVEAAEAAVKVIRQNLLTLEITTGQELAWGEALRGVKSLEFRKVVCQFCFVDPPYRLNKEYGVTLKYLSEASVLNATSIVIAEHTRHFDPDEVFGRLRRFRKLQQGDSVLSFYRLADAEDSAEGTTAPPSERR